MMTEGKKPRPFRRRFRNEGDLRRAYEHLHKQQVDPGMIGNWKDLVNGRQRKLDMLAWLEKNVPVGVKRYCPRVLDVSCGPGGTMAMLRDFGYEVWGTEFTADLCRQLCKAGLRVWQMSYSRLHTIATDSYDVVISEEVLEHLPSEEAVEEALRQLCRISRKAICLTVGYRPNRGCTKRLGLGRVFGITGIHVVKRLPGWWLDMVYERLRIDVREIKLYEPSISFFGFVKKGGEHGKKKGKGKKARGL